MADIVDHANDLHEQEIAFNIQAARQNRFNHRTGPIKCVRCNDYNDRSDDGFCICTDCMETPIN